MARKSNSSRDPSSAIRIGMGNRPLSDLYYRLLKAPWWALVLFLLAGYVIANLVFAALYASCGDCIEAVEPGNYADAFFFSVQTISTIGYGHLYPTTNFAEIIVTLESVTGLFGFAVVTGMVFSKFALPNSRIRFSEPLLISNYDGEPTLHFRVGNARGNDIVEASVRVVVLLREETKEGHSMRRLHDLKLVRSRTPLFTLSWLVQHTIDEQSPLCGLNKNDFEREGLIFIVTMTGHDGTFNQTVHARNIYRWENLRWDEDFVDVIGATGKGQIVVDFGLFHDTKPAHGKVDIPEGPPVAAPLEASAQA